MFAEDPGVRPVRVIVVAEEEVSIGVHEIESVDQAIL
jgi:hypothetical protein